MNQIRLMYITNDPQTAIIAENAGVDRIFVDLEYIGKEERQGGLDTVKSSHTIEDIKSIRGAIKKSELLVRSNVIHEATKDYCSSKEEIDRIIEAGADIIMLPYFKTVEEVKTFIKLVDGRAKTFPLVETKEAVENIDEILEIDGIDEIYIGLNDLSLSYGKKFLFELLCDGTVEKLVKKFKQKGIPFGFGGVASVGKGLLPSEYVLREHYRLGSSSVILSRSFCNTDKISDITQLKDIFEQGIKNIREFEKECINSSAETFKKNKQEIEDIVNSIVRSIK